MAVDRVLVLRALGLGDLLTAVPALRAVRRAHPGARVQLATPRALAPLALLSGAVDEVVDAAPLGALPAAVAGADLAVNLHGKGPQSTALLAATRPRRLLAYGLPDAPAWRDDEHEVHRWCRLVAAGGMPADTAALDLPAPDAEPAATGAVLVHPGAAQVSRRWPAERWGAVARALAADGHDVRLTGGPDEVDLARAVAAAAGLPEDAVLAGRTDLLRLSATVAAALLLLSPDTGVAHLATALGTPSVVLFGPSPPALWGPPPDRPRHRVLWAGRRGDNFAPHPDPGLLALTVDDVVAAARAALV